MVGSGAGDLYTSGEDGGLPHNDDLYSKVRKTLFVCIIFMFIGIRKSIYVHIHVKIKICKSGPRFDGPADAYHRKGSRRRDTLNEVVSEC